MPNDPRIRAFLDRAAAIVAASKGLTVECQQQLEVLATQLRLDPGQWNQCLDELKSQTRGEQTYSRYEQAFLDAAKKNLASITGRILSLGKEKLLLELAAEKFQIGQVRAHQLLETCCEELDIRRISRTDTEASFRELAISLTGTASRAAPETISQLIDAGKGWGLTETEVRTIVNHVVVSNSRRKMRRISRGIKLVVLVAIVAGTIAWSANFAIRYDWRNPTGPVETGGDTVTDPMAVAAWFPAGELDRKLESIDENPRLTELCRRLAHESPNGRTDTYSQIAELSLDPFGPAPEYVAGLLDLLLAADPDSGTVSEWENTFAEELESRTGSVPVSGDSMRRALRLADLAAHLDNHNRDNDRTRLVADRLTSLNRTKLGNNGPAGLILDWWAQLVYQEPTPVARAVAVTAMLHQFSLQYLTETLANQWRQRLLMRVVHASPESVGQLADDLGSAILSSTPVELESWVHVWRQLGSAPQRDMIGRLVLKHPAVDRELASSGSVESSMNRLAIDWIRKRHAAVFELQTVADQSLQQARLARLNTVDLPQSIAITAQAVNDALQVIRRTSSIHRNPGEGVDSVSPWRLELTANESALSEPALTGNQPMATQADYRTLDEAIAELESAGLYPERAGYRILALEELQRIAPRLDDIPASAASTLANRFMQEMSVEEWLAVEKSLPAFRFWPNFGLALADRISNGSVILDQALSVTQLVADAGFRLDKSGDWRGRCSRAIAGNVAHILEQQLLPAETKEDERWQRARAAIGRIYFSRRQILGETVSESEGQMTPAVQAIRLAMTGFGRGDAADLEIQEAFAIAGNNELEVTVQAAVVAARQLGQELKGRLPTGTEWNGFPSDANQASAMPTNLGNQLLAIESDLLEFLTLIRLHQVRQLTGELP